MKIKILKEIKDKNPTELGVIEKKTRETLAHLNLDLKSGKLKNMTQLFEAKKNLARIKTVIRERQLYEKA